MSRAVVINKIKHSYHKTKLSLQCMFQDLSQNIRYMNNWQRNKPDYWQLSSELIFNYHKIEKGLSLPGEKRFFGSLVARKTLSLLEEWRLSGFSQTDQIYLGSIESLRKYIERFPSKIEDAQQSRLYEDIHTLLTFEPHTESLITPYNYESKVDRSHMLVLESLAMKRRSVRSFKDTKVDIELVKKAVLLGQQAPSACNRQASRVHLYQKGDLQQKLLSLQNGNRGFGHQIPLLAIITSESKTFFDMTERNEPYLDGGLFLGYLLLGLESLGLSTCCLNWSTSPWHDNEARKLANIEPSEKILTFLAIGYAEEGAVVPRSARRSLDTILFINR